MYFRTAMAVVILTVYAAVATASINDLTQWTELNDPPTLGLSSTVDSPSQITLSASGGIPNLADIGYASINGEDVANSTSGFAFDPSAPFSVAIDFDVNTINSIGAGGIGFGVGEDIDGTDSAGVVLGLVNGAAAGFSGFGRVGNNDVSPAPINVSPFSSGRLFVNYSPNGGIGVGVNPTPGSVAPTSSASLGNIASQWDSDRLLVSFFLRSQEAPPFSIFPGIPSLTAGDIDAEFSNFEVISGSPVQVPEPATVTLALVTAMGVCMMARRRKRA